MEIRNIAIIAHVDHGKTTLVDAMLKQTHSFRDNQKEMTQNLILDSNDLEREKGITILSKNTSIFYKAVKINIIDTPGHADFGGEVERVLNMASYALLLVDAAEGPLPQTKFVLKKAIEENLGIILIINKIDRKDARPKEVLEEVENLFLELAKNPENLDFTVLYAVGRDGKAFYTLPQNYTNEMSADLEPIFETILEKVPDSSKKENLAFQMLISTLDYDEYVGKLCIGKVSQGKLHKGEDVALVDDNRIVGTYKVQKMFTYFGIERRETEEASCGDIIAIAGIPELTIGYTVCDPVSPISLPKITVEEPIIKVVVSPNTSPFTGREGKYHTSRQIRERLLKEAETNLGLKISELPDGFGFNVSGRGELHLAVLFETMRREGYEMQIEKPEVIYKNVGGEVFEPFEEVTIEVRNEYLGKITEEMAKRKGTLVNMVSMNNDNMRVIYKISSQNLLGIRNNLLIKTRGTALISTYLLGYFPKGKKVLEERNGALIALFTGKSLSFGLSNAQERGTLFIGPQEDVYEGMVVGVGARNLDMEVNVTKAKKQTNVRSETADIAIQLVPPVRFSLEQAIDFLKEDELLEITPRNIRMRKKYLTMMERKLVKRKSSEKS